MLVPEGYTQARKRPDGKWQLFYIGTRNEVYPGVLFASLREARQYFRAMNAKEDTGRA